MIDKRSSHRRAVAVSSRADENAHEAFVEHLLTFFREPYAMLFAYQDESCTHEGAVAMTVAAVLYDSAGLQTLNDLWIKELNRAGVKHLHVADLGGPGGEFKGKTHDFVYEVYKNLISIIARCSLGSAAVCSVPVLDFDAARVGGWKYSPYTICSLACMFSATRIAKSLGHEQVSFFVENGHENAGEFMRAVEHIRAADGWREVAAFAMQGKMDLHALSTADVVAYETAKRLKDMISEPGRQLRKSLKAIIENNPNHQLQPIPSEAIEMVLGHLP